MLMDWARVLGLVTKEVVYNYFRGLKAEPNILEHALSKVEVVQEKIHYVK